MKLGTPLLIQRKAFLLCLISGEKIKLFYNDQFNCTAFSKCITWHLTELCNISFVICWSICYKTSIVGIDILALSCKEWFKINILKCVGLTLAYVHTLWNRWLMLVFWKGNFLAQSFFPEHLNSFFNIINVETRRKTFLDNSHKHNSFPFIWHFY